MWVSKAVVGKRRKNTTHCFRGFPVAPVAGYPEMVLIKPEDPDFALPGGFRAILFSFRTWSGCQRARFAFFIARSQLPSRF